MAVPWLLTSTPDADYDQLHAPAVLLSVQSPQSPEHIGLGELGAAKSRSGCAAEKSLALSGTEPQPVA